ncbi:hypothetical protein SLS57_009532 [Botryosphaeria dothidea]
MKSSISLISLATALMAPLSASMPTASLSSTANNSTTTYCPPRPASPAEQRQIFEDFIDLVFVQRDATTAYLKYVAEDYIQHNPSVLSGRNNSLVAVTELVTPETTFEIQSTAFEADRGWVFSRVVFPGAEQPTAVVDVVRLDGSCLVEHWDVMQQRPADAINPLDLW